MEERRRTRSQGPPTPIENNELIQWDPVQDTVRRERGRTETDRLAGQTNVVNNTRKNRTENSEISQEQHSNETDHEQRTTFTPTMSEIPPKEQPLEDTGSQASEIPPIEQRPGNIGPQQGEISPEERRLEDTGVQPGEIPQQKVHQLNTNEPMRVDQRESP